MFWPYIAMIVGLVLIIGVFVYSHWY